MSTSIPAPNSETTTTYDETPYPSSSFPQTQPNRLAAMGRLFGLETVDPSKSRVLELGCADGSNLLPIAEQLPGATFVGVDSSKVAIAAGQKAVAATGLKNIELRHQDILEFPADEGKFDYIIVHGVYSWVSEPVREKLLAICAEHLTEKGVAYISYNAHPGWNLRRSLRDMMLFHTRTFPDAKVKVQQARALMGFLAESVPASDNVYGTLLKNELNHLNNYPDGFLLHDILGQENTPVYFHQFVAHAGKHGLQYLAESSLSEMLASNFPEKVRLTLGQLNNQIVAQEQYMDFLRNRSFRQTLLCRTGVPLRRNISPQAMSQFAFRSLVGNATGPIELVPGVAVSFATPGGAQITSNDVFVKAVLWTLSETRGVAALGYRDLLETARTRSRPFFGEVAQNRSEVDETTMQTNLLNLLSKGLIELYAEPVRVRTDIPEKPQVSGVARYESLHARVVTNRVHQPMPADVLSRYVLAACDGTKTRDEIVASLAERVMNGELHVNEGSVKVTEPAKLPKLLGPKVEAALAAIAAGGFFAA